MPTPPVTNDETLYRQIGVGGNPIYFDPSRQPPIHRSLFLPSPNDSDGLSLIRARFRAAAWAAFRVEHPEVRYRLAQLLAAELEHHGQNVGFSDFPIESTSDALDDKHGPPFAHCVAIRINRVDYDSNAEKKKLIKEWALRVSDCLTRTAIIGPFAMPVDGDAYRP